MPSLIQIKQDIHRYFNKYNPNLSFLKRFEDDSMEFTKNTNNPQYFKDKNGKYTIGDEEDLYIEIRLSSLESKYAPQINFKFITTVKLSDSKTREIEYEDSENLVDFMNEWESYSWKSLFKGFIRHVESQLNIKSKKSNDIDWDNIELPDDINELIEKIYELDNSKPENLSDFTDRLIAKFKLPNEYKSTLSGIIETDYGKNIESKAKIKTAILDINSREAEELANAAKIES